MTYLDPEQSRTVSNRGPLLLKVLAIAAIVAFGWFAFTLGDKDGTGRPNIVAEPTATAPQAE